MSPQFCLLRAFLIVALCAPLSAMSGETADFVRAVNDVRLGARLVPQGYLACDGTEEGGGHCEGALGSVKVQAELREGRVVGFYVRVDDVRMETEVLPALRALYGAEARKQEGVRAETAAPELGLRRPAAGYASYEWQQDKGKIILFGQDPFLAVFADGRVEVTEPAKTYASGELREP